MIQSELDRYTVTYNTAHYVFHCLPGSKAAKDIARIATYQEKWFDKITKTLGVTPPWPIKYYLTNTPEDVGLIDGDGEPCNGFASGPDTVVATYSDTVFCLGPHEDTHLIAGLIAYPDSVFLREGLAMLMDAEWWGQRNEWWVQQFIAEGRLVSLSELVDNDAFFALPDAVTYPIAGAFTLFACEALGQQAFMDKVYRHPGQAAEALTDAFQKTLPEIEEAFIGWIKAQDIDEKIETDIIF